MLPAGDLGYAFRLVENEDLWLKREEWVKDFFTLLSANKRTRLAYSESKARGRERAEAKLDLRDGLSHWLSLWRDVLLLRTNSGTPLTNLDREDEVRQLAERVSEKQAAGFVRRLEHSFARIQGANLQLMLDNILLEWAEK